MTEPLLTLGESLGLSLPGRMALLDRFGSYAANRDADLALRDLALIRQDVEVMTAHVVKQLRAQHASWADIGNALGITQQAAHKRFRHLEG